VVLVVVLPVVLCSYGRFLVDLLVIAAVSGELNRFRELARNSFLPRTLGASCDVRLDYRGDAGPVQVNLRSRSCSSGSKDSGRRVRAMSRAVAVWPLASRIEAWISRN
jgi:hypothetical protein